MRYIYFLKKEMSFYAIKSTRIFVEFLMEKFFPAKDIRNRKCPPGVKHTFQKKRRGRAAPELGLIFPFFLLNDVDCLCFTLKYSHLLSSGFRGPGGCPQLPPSSP